MNSLRQTKDLGNKLSDGTEGKKKETKTAT